MVTHIRMDAEGGMFSQGVRETEMSREQYEHERLDLDANHTPAADAVVSMGAIFSAVFLLAVML